MQSVRIETIPAQAGYGIAKLEQVVDSQPEALPLLKFVPNCTEKLPPQDLGRCLQPGLQ